MVTRTRAAVVVGAGIAGLTTSIALARRGWAVEILELSPDGRTAGWGGWVDRVVDMVCFLTAVTGCRSWRRVAWSTTTGPGGADES